MHKLRFISLIIGTLYLIASPVAIADNESGFTDVDSSTTYQTGIEYLSTLGIVNGNPDGTYKPNGTLNRAEMLKILVEATVEDKPTAPETQCFNDVSLIEWYSPYVCYGKTQGWVVGYENGKTFKPDQSVNIVEALKMTLEAFDINYDTNSEVWYKGVVDAASENNYIPFDVNSFATGFQRGQMADLITRIIKKKSGKLSEYLGDRKGITVNYESIEAGLNLADQEEDLASNNDQTSKQTDATKNTEDMQLFDDNQNSIITLVQKKIEALSVEEKGIDSFVKEIEATMNKYLSSNLIQTSGQSLLDDSYDLAYKLEKLIETGENLIKETNTQIGTGVITQLQESLVGEFTNYIDEYENLNTKMESKISTFVLNQKTVLENELYKKEDELERKQTALQILDQLDAIIQNVDNQFVVLNSEIEEIQTQIDETYNLKVSMAKATLIVAPLINKYNALVSEWNSLLDTKDLVIGLRYAVEDYYETGSPLGAENKALLKSLGITF